MKKLLAKIHVPLLTLIVGLFASSSAFGAVPIVIQNNDQPGVGFNDPTPVAPIGGNAGTTIGQQRLNSFQFAANIWGATLTGGPTITVRGSWAALACTATSATLGAAGAISIRKDFGGASFAATWYSVALANALSGSDLNGTTAEISARFNMNVGTTGCLEGRQWYYGLDTNHGTTRINLVTVLLHEFAHGLGFQTFTDEETGEQASGFPSIYDRFLLDNSAGKTWVQMTDAERVASAINAGNLVWNGPQVTNDAATVLTAGKDSLGHARIFAPNPIDLGSSVSHWDTVATPNQLMEPNISTSLSHNVTPPQDLTFSLMKDIGWPGTAPPPPSPPPNDNFTNAQLISGCSGSVTGTNVGATRETGEPNHSPDNGGGSRSVWYQWQSPSNTNVTITTAGSAFDTVLAVYTGTSVSSLTPAAPKSDDISASDKTSRVDFFATVATIYRIAVDGYNNASGGDTGAIQLNWTASPCIPTTGSTIQLSAANYVVSESASGPGAPAIPVTSVIITVTRSGDASGVATVGYSTVDDPAPVPCNPDDTTQRGTAYARCDYATTIDTLTFAAGETLKTFAVPLINDVHVEGSETFPVQLANAQGATLGTPSTAIVTITDDDGPGQANPIFQSAFFVRQHYLDFLSREPDLPGFNSWLNVLNGCSDVNNNPVCDRILVSLSFFGSQEFQLKGYFVYRFYKLAFNRLPAYTELIPDMRAVTGQSGNEVFQKKAVFTAAFVQRPEFVALYAGLTNDQYVSALMGRYGLTQITTPDPANPDGTQKVTMTSAQLTAQLGGTLTRAQVLRAIADSDNVFNLEFNQSFVAMQYYGYLRRSPDTGGYNNWLNYLSTHPGDFRTMVDGFMNSQEYRLRFGSP